MEHEIHLTFMCENILPDNTRSLVPVVFRVNERGVRFGVRGLTGHLLFTGSDLVKLNFALEKFRQKIKGD